MKRTIKYSLQMMAIATAGVLGACNQFDPETPDIPNLPTVNNLTVNVANRQVNLSWQLPSGSPTVTGVNVIVNNNRTYSVDGAVTSYSVSGMPMEVENMFTVKLRYEGGYVSQGQSVTATVPFETLADLTSFTVSELEGRNVTFSWTLPQAAGITGVWVGIDGQDNGTVFSIADNPTGGTLGGQKTGVDLKFRAKVVYDEYYYSDGVVVNTALPAMETKVGYLVLADDVADLPDDDELAAAAWFFNNYVETGEGDFIYVSDLADLDYDLYGCIWIMVDRLNLGKGWQHLPANLISQETLAALTAYGANGGNLYLAKMATQLTTPLGIGNKDIVVNAFSDQDGGEGGDIWTLNPFLGWDYRPGGLYEGQQGYYDRSAHPIYEGLEISDPNNWGVSGIPLEGPGHREDHNSLWDLNPYWEAAGKPAPDCISWFQDQTNSIVLGTWGHVRDHCVAAVVEFNPTSTHGRVIANGINCYEFEQNGVANPYQDNIYKLTSNILNYLK